MIFFFFSSRRRHTRWNCDWSSDVCSSDLLPVVDPAKVLAPTLVVRGEYDGIATEQDLLDFYRKLPNPDRQFSILPGLAHSLALGINRKLFWHCARAFLESPRAAPI